MSDVVERFMRYVQVDSQSDPNNLEATPSTPVQHKMAEVLAGELAAIGCANVQVDEHAYVTGELAASAGCEDAPALVLCAHIDTAPDAPAAGVAPRIVRYEGGDLVMGTVDGELIKTDPVQVPDLAQFVGQDIVVTDGRTLLGADDKAGVAEICALLARLVANPELKHPRVIAAFVPDEEIGHGAELLDLERLGARWGYTVDGGALGEFNYECFSASEATVRIKGVMVHPGSAKDIMVNAITLASEYQQMIPAAERPEHTDRREGYYHPTDIEGSASEVTLKYILRDFDSADFARREKTMQDVADFMNARYGAGTVSVTIREQYRNMFEKFGADDQRLIDFALEANREVGLDPVVVAARGGTDGAQLTFRGLPCPNLATGGYNAHSVREFVPCASLELTVDLLERLVAKFADVRL